MQRIHGLLLSSAHALPGLPPAPGAEPDVSLHLADTLAPADPAAVTILADGPVDAADTSLAVRRDPDGRVTFRYGDGHALDVRMAPDGRATIGARIAPGETLDDLTAYLYGPVLGYVLRVRGTLALHAGSVRTRHGALLLAGASGAGKSTTAAALAARGCPVLSDDMTALSFHAQGVTAHAAFSYLRVWASSEAMLYGRAGVLAPMSPTWSKLRLPLAAGQFAAGDEPVRAVAMLGPRGAAVAPRAERLGPAVAVARLSTCTNANWLRDTAAQQVQLERLSALVERIPVWWVEPSADPARLPELCDLLLRIADGP